MVGITGRGNAADARTPIRSLSEWVAKFGVRADSPFLYDAAEFYFKEGGRQIFTSRTFGPAPVEATINIFDQAGSVDPGDIALVATAKSPGAWANTMRYAILAGDAGGEFKIQLTDTADSSVDETSPSLVDRAAAVAWATAESDLIDLTLGASNEDPRVVAASGTTQFAGGTDDSGSATDATWLAAVNQFTRDLGPGQITFPGMTTAARHAQIINHAQTYNRVGILDAPDTGTKATLLAVEAGITAGNANSKRFGALFAPWVVVPGLTSGTTRTVPPSAIVAGIMSRNDGRGVGSNQPSAGALGESITALSLSQTAFSDADREDLNEANVNLLRELYGGIRIYGYRTLTDPTTDAIWVNLANVRLFMEITAKGDAIGERFVFRQLDGRRHTCSEYGGELTSMLLPYWEAGALYGDSPNNAFFVDVGESVNTDVSMAAGYLKASIRLKLSEFAEEVVLDLVKSRSTETIE